MNNIENDLPEFTLEEIMREFGSGSDTPPPEEAGDAPGECPEAPSSDCSTEAEETAPPAEDVPEEESPDFSSPEPDEAPQPQPSPADSAPREPAVPETTQKFEAIRCDEPSAPEETQRFEAIDPDSTQRFEAVDPDSTQRFSPVTDEAEAAPSPESEDAPASSIEDTAVFPAIHPEGEETPPDPAPEHTEAFSEDWEPEYDAPMGEYTPPEPIIFQPRSRLRELKQKLVAGPERRYYELMEQGLSRLQAVIFLSFLVLIAACGALTLYALGMVRPERMRLLVFCQVLAMLVATLLGTYQLMGGLASLFRGRVTADTALFFTLIVCCVDSFFCLKTLRVPYCAAYCLEVTLSLLAEYHRRNTEMGQMDTMRKASCLGSVVKVADYYDGRPGLLRADGEVDDFMDHYTQISTPQKVLSRYLIIAMIVSVVTGVAIALFRGWLMGLQVLTASMLTAVPATCFITLSRPAAVLERKLHKVGAVLCGWDGMRELSRPATVPLSDQDLFPEGSVKMNGMKFFGSRDPDQIIAYVTALVTAGGGGLLPLFQQILDSRNGRHYEVESFRIYAGGGLGGQVNGEPVLVGPSSLLHDMGVEIPEGTRVNQALYASIDGDLCGVFAVTYQKTRSSAAGLSSLTSYRSLTPVLTCGDFMLTESFLRKKFNVNTRRIAFPAQNLRHNLAARQPEPDLQGLAMFTRPTLASFAYAITGARALRSASILGVIIHIIAGCLGLGIVAVLAVLGSGDLLSPDHLMLYELVWMIPGFLITEWTRTV